MSTRSSEDIMYNLNTFFDSEELRKWVRGAYKKLKSETYYDSISLWLREKIGEFEDEYLEEKLDKVASLFHGLYIDKDLNIFGTDSIAKSWLEDITCKIIPKGLKEKNDEAGSLQFFSNVQTDTEYKVKQVDYFIDAPVEIHLISILWVMTVGNILEKDMDKGSYGSRLHKDVERPNARMFKMFFQQYEQWRDSTLDSAQELLDRDKDLLLVTLDFKECFYHVQIDWDLLTDTIKDLGYASGVLMGLNEVLKVIHQKYYSVVKQYMSVSHKHIEIKDDILLPIGLPSSGVLANWHLTVFDKAIREKLEPHHYSRYVDDVFIIIENPTETDDPTKILKKYFRDKKILGGKASELHCIDLKNMKIKDEKFIIQYFHPAHSRSALKVFTEEIKKRASDAHFLPESDFSRELDQSAYDLVYIGSINKWRSVIDIKENGTEISKYLAKQIQAHRLTEKDDHDEVTSQLIRFFQGRNLFNLMRTWEKVFSYFIIKRKYQEAFAEILTITKTINQLKFEDTSIQNKLHNDLRGFLRSAITLPIALLGENVPEIINDLDKHNCVNTDAIPLLRRCNLVRHQYVALPLLSYTDFNGDYTQFNEKNVVGIELNKVKTDYSPRFLHIDEHIQFSLLNNLTSNGFVKSLDEQYSKIIADYFSREEPPIFIKENMGLDSVKRVGISVGKQTLAKKIKIGIANIDVPESDIEQAYLESGKQNISFKKQSELFELLNTANKQGCNLLVLPEVSVPLRWLSVMASHARKWQIGLVFGVEHTIVDGSALNLMATILPFVEEGKYKSSFVSLRVKNHYAPAEIEAIVQDGKNAPELEASEYHLFYWKGIQFTVYNCFELSDIQHRSIFKSELDLLIASVWNRDTKYYSNIIESVSRDLFCYAVQVNTSKFGDSKVVQPSSSVCMTLASISGGCNTSLQVAEIDIDKLRKFQAMRIHTEKEKKMSEWKKLKQCPPGYRHEVVRNRGDIAKSTLFTDDKTDEIQSQEETTEE